MEQRHDGPLGAKQQERRSDCPRAQIAATRAEVVEILAGAIFTLILKGQARPISADGEAQLGERS